MNISKFATIGLLIAGIFTVMTCTRAGQESGMQAESEKEFSVDVVSLNNLMQTSLETLEGGEVTVSLVEIPSDTVLAWHYHPGEEFIYVMEGSATLLQQDQPDTLLTKGDVFKVPYEQVHTARTGDESVRVLVFRVHREGEPERVLTEEE